MLLLVDKHFYVSDGMNKVGPFSKEEVYQMLFSAHISITDFILDSRDNRMCPLLQHEDFGGSGDTISGGSSIPNSKPPQVDLFGFAELRKQGKILRDPNQRHRYKKEDEIKVKETEKANPTPTIAAVTDYDETVFYNTQTNANSNDLSKITQIDQIVSASNTLKNNTSLNFFVKTKDKEYGPLKFLVLLSLLKQNKLKLDIQTRIESETQYKNLSDYVPKELLQTIQITPILNPSVLPKTKWQRKNVRIDYDDIVLLNNKNYSLVGRTLDLSTDGISTVWVYDLPLNEKFEITLFDLEKNPVKVEGYLARKEKLANDSNINLYKAVFIFYSSIQIKNFIK